MKYKYKINKLKLFGYHGVYDNEKREGQYFLISAEFNVNYDIYKLDDDLINVIDYKILCDDINEAFKKRCNLIETLIFNIKSYLENKYQGLEFNISIKKESLLIEHKVQSILVDEGPSRMWRKFGARGRYKPIKRRTAHIKVTLVQVKD